MNQVKVNETAYRGAGWAWALRIGGGEVVHARFVDAAADGFPSAAEITAALEAFKCDPVVIAAEALGQAAWSALEAASAKSRSETEDEEIERLDAAFEACAARIQLGMMSGGFLCVDFDKIDRARAGLPKNAHV